jgi:hypothetical protein
VAVNLDAKGYEDFEPNVNVQVGWLWRNPFERMANVRLFGEYYNGFSPYGAGPFFRAKESFFAAGLSCDF